MAVKVIKKTRRLTSRVTQAVAWFLGSWWAVILHTIWFGVWLIFNFDINLLTFSVSLEAIFIGIFLLMSSNKAEELRDRREARQQAQEQQRIEHDIKLDEKADRQLTEIKKLHQDLHQEIKSLKKQVQKLQKAS